MSGILASSMLPQDASCKIYTNSSGNAASVTIHAHVPSTTENACLSIKISGTDACICTNAVDKTTDIVPTDTGSITHTSANVYDGYTCLQNTGTGKRSITTMAYVDSGDACHSTIDSPGITSMNALVYSSNGNRLTSSTHFGTCAYCCPRREVYACDSACCDTLWAYLSRPMPNFHTPTSGEKHVHLPIKCCNLACFKTYASYNYHELNGSDCCFLLTSTPEKKYETFYNTFDDSVAKPGCGEKFHKDTIFDSFCTGWYAVDLWSCFGTMAYYEEFAPPTSCPSLRVRYRVRICCEQACYTSCQINLPRCQIQNLLDNNIRKIMLECCNCRACCCKIEDVADRVGFPSRKPVMFGCDFAFLQRTRGAESYFTAYRYDCAACMANQFCQVCSIQPVWISLGSYMCDSCGCNACCIRTFKINDLGEGIVKYAWYNPYLNCNYIYIMDGAGTGCDYGGTYSFETRCIDKDGIISSEYNTDAKRNICKNFADYVSDGFFQKVQSVPTAWERFTCICSNAGCFTMMTNPSLVGTCCWAVWAQCFNYGDTTLDATGWNGCMLRYHSNDLANWKLTDGSIILKIDQGSGDAICSKAFINDGSNFSTSVNHYFNSANCVNDAGTIEYKTSLNRLERTGIVLSNNSNVYVNNTGSCVGVTIWGYDE